MKYLFLLFLILVAVLGMYFYSNQVSSNKEGFDKDSIYEFPTEDDGDSNCPNVLVKRGDKLFLYNTTKPDGPENPVTFANLDEYIKYLEKQRNEGIRCPVLYLQQENDAQGQDVYRVRPSPFSLEGGLPPVNPAARPVVDASRENPPYNTNMYPGFDPYGQYTGVYTKLDAIHDSTEQAPVSDNPMDTNWGGVRHSVRQVASGKYAGNEVGRPQENNPVGNYQPGPQLLQT